MPRFLSDVPHNIYRRRAFAIAAIVTGLFFDPVRQSSVAISLESVPLLKDARL